MPLVHGCMFVALASLVRRGTCRASIAGVAGRGSFPTRHAAAELQTCGLQTFIPNVQSKRNSRRNPDVAHPKRLLEICLDCVHHRRLHPQSPPLAEQRVGAGHSCGRRRRHERPVLVALRSIHTEHHSVRAQSYDRSHVAERAHHLVADKYRNEHREGAAQAHASSADDIFGAQQHGTIALER